MTRFISFSMVCAVLLCSGCVSPQVNDKPIEQVRADAREAEPACFLQFNECDENGANCRLVRTEYQDAGGTTHTWAQCNTEYAAWLKRLDVARTLLRKKDPFPQCVKLGASDLKALGVDPKDPDAMVTLAEHGTVMGNPACTAEWCSWMERNFEPGRSLPITCTHPDP